ncbi:MAG: peroxiredoxin family protein, partial [Planctomycetota bacterium]
GRLVRVERSKKVPIPNADVKIEQPDRASYTHLGFHRDQTTVTDLEGRFQFEHLRTKIRPHGSMRDKQWKHIARVWKISYGETSETIAFYDGTKIENFELIVKPDPAQAQSLVGKALPAFDGIEIDLPADYAKGKAVLVCFFDMEQRPSRYSMFQLAKKADQLTQKGVTVVAVQISQVDEDKLSQWAKNYGIPFPVGMAQGDQNEIRAAWGVKSLPWLILTDKDHTIREEGFGLTDLWYSCTLDL